MKKKDKLKIIVFMFLLYFLFIIFYAVLQSNSINLFYTLGKLSGLIGFLCLSFLIFSGDTARFFDRFFGIDKIIKFQRRFSLITCFFVLFHPIFFMLSSKNILNYIFPDFTFIVLAFGIISFYIFIIIMISSLIYKRISYKSWQYIHVLIYILFFFSFYHAINGSDFSYLKFFYIILFILVIIGIIYRTIYKIKTKPEFKVKKVIKETKDIFTLVLFSNKKFNFIPGQFCFLRLNKDKLYARHPFSIVSSPQEKNLSFTIKLKGRFTQELLKLKEEEEVILDGPFGIFTIQESNKDIVFIAGGIGITPFMSIIRNQVLTQKKQKITLFYCVKTRDDLIFKEELNNIKVDWLKVIYIFSEDSNYPGSCEFGYPSKEIIKKYLWNVENSLFYICGPEPMKKSCKKFISNLNVKKKNIIVEDFFW
ncbi:MAG TPA: ferric reductase-like transmembrane domain-containing protein [Candidatus Nanoarchaeia archaeon]|nr:ferric reductase-like transmembrane domain-containing protein [Candidatus Nanoarchaeia archaeon]